MVQSVDSLFCLSVRLAKLRASAQLFGPWRLQVVHPRLDFAGTYSFQAIEFYDRQWNMKGTKLSLSTVLSRLTGVDEEIIRDSELVYTASVAKRMSWAASRQTTRVEDMSYCLFGLFDVHLPLIYGEGWKAFVRLQEAIILETSDLSIFAWRVDFADQAHRGVLTV